MRRLANGTQVNSLPPAAAAIGTPGYGTDGNPAAGQQSSTFDAAAFNIIQEELVAPIVSAGIPLDSSGTNNEQLLAALRLLFTSGGVDFIATTRPFVVPPSVTRLRRIRVWGGGAGGGGSKNQGSAACGGGAGGYAEKRNVAVTPGQSILATVGEAGTAGEPNTPADGGAGGATSFGTIVSASGGEGGRAANGAVQPTASNFGTGFNADFLMPGKPGATGYALSATQCFGGLGGAPPWGSQSGLNMNSVGQAGTYPGGGGGGGAFGQPGGAGAPGLIIVEW
jgi:hypothetical protein